MIDNNKEIKNSQWYMDTQNLIMDPSSTGSEIMGSLKDVYHADGSIDHAKLQAVQYLMQERQQVMTAVSNLMRSLHEMAMAMIRNFRLN